MILPACQSVNETIETSEAVSDNTTKNDAENDLHTDLPTGDYMNTEFVFANETQSGLWSILMLDCETITGDVLDNAVYQRNRSVAEKLGITIKIEEFDNSDKLRDALITNVMSGDDPYHVYDICANYSGALILEDCFVDVDTLDLDLEKPWWNDTVTDPTTVFDWGGPAGALNDTAFAGKREISSKIASIESKIKTDIQLTVEYYGE